ncbi:phage tail protein [Longispora sp. K20-0274]|uniref:phage tail protein n=1 Tax=Longispora sp. K20-0274 TaxID=3088255 RepID=UPI003999A9C8
MPLPDLDGAVGHSFGLEVDGVMITQINEVSGLKFEQDVIELKTNTPDGKYMIKKLPGRVKAGEVTFTRSLTGSNSFEKWMKDSRLGKMADARKTAAVIIFDYEQKAIKRYILHGAWLKSLEIGSLKAGDTSVLTEKAVVTYEEMVVE